MIWITGDTHGDWMSRLNRKAFPEQKQMTKEDYVIILGDFGIWDDSKSEKYNLDWLEDKPFTTLFVSGNHENYDILDALPVSEWHGGKVNFVRSSIIHLMRGEIFTIEGKTFFAFGGAGSHDIGDGILEAGDPRIKKWRKDTRKRFRINHVSWWERELPTEEEMNHGRRNLEKCNYKVDYIVTHSPAAGAVSLVGQGVYKQDILTEYLEEICTETEYKKHFCGHMHINKQISDKEILLYEQIVRIS